LFPSSASLGLTPKCSWSSYYFLLFPSPRLSESPYFSPPVFFTRQNVFFSFGSLRSESASLIRGPVLAVERVRLSILRFPWSGLSQRLFRFPRLVGPKMFRRFFLRLVSFCFCKALRFYFFSRPPPPLLFVRSCRLFSFFFRAALHSQAWDRESRNLFHRELLFLPSTETPPAFL